MDQETGEEIPVVSSNLALCVLGAAQNEVEVSLFLGAPGSSTRGNKKMKK